MNLSDFNFDLPKSLIAQEQVSPRDHSKLLVLNKKSGRLMHAHFYDLPNFMSPNDILVLNNTKVFPARIWGEREDSGGIVQIFLHKELSPGRWEVIGKNLRAGKVIKFKQSNLVAKIEEKNDESAIVRFNLSGNSFFEELEKIGMTPLPPYIKRSKDDEQDIDDRANYQTIYAKQRGSVAAPTAGLHFTDGVLDQIEQKGIEVLEVTLHVGLGTFMPIKVENFKEHKMHREAYSISKDVYKRLIEGKREGKRVIAVGTTTTRMLEHLFKTNSPLSGTTDIFIYPGYKFQCVDGLITNFHLPKSSLLLLVSALAGREKIVKAYEEAIKNDYRFYSYGDAMLII